MQDVSFSAYEFAPGERKEVNVALTGRSFEAVDSFRLQFEATPEVTITPASIEFKGGKPDTATVVLEIRANAAPGSRTIKLRTTPDARIGNWHITVADPADRHVDETSDQSW
jgi:hypothetical protein